MSYQTVSDIFVGSQNNCDFQKKDLGSGSGVSGNSSSFGELVSFYKSENNSGIFHNDNSLRGSDSYNNKLENDRFAAAADERARSAKAAADKNNSYAAEKTSESDADEMKGSVSKPESAVEASEGKKDVSDVEGNKKQENVKDERDNLKADDLAQNNSKSKSKNTVDSPEFGFVNEQNGKKTSGKNKDGKNSKDEKSIKLTDKDFSRMQEFGGHKGVSGVVEAVNGKNTKDGRKTGAEKNVRSVDLEKVEVVSEKKLAAGEVSYKLEKEATLEEAAKNAGIQSNINSAVDNNEKNIKSANKDNEDSLFDISETEKSKGQVFMDKDKKISVEDLRTSTAESVDVADGDNKSKFKVSEPKIINENTANITMEMRQNVNTNVMSSNGQTAAANGSNFQAMLNNQIQQSAPEFVKAGNLVLKDNNQGTINLLLRPDELGNVKLHLSLDGKNISGHITVATKEALDVFKDNAETLREAFIKSGFESASFDVSYSGNNGAGQENAFQQQNDGKEFVAKKVYGNHSDNSDGEFDKIVEKNDKNKEYSINIVA